MSFYPPIDIPTLRSLAIVRKLSAEQPDYFDNAPYPNAVKEFLGVVDTPNRNAPPTPPPIPEELDVLKEVRETYRELMEHKPDYQDAAATQAYFRTRTNLLEKLLEQMERGRSQKQVSEFYSLVISTLEELATPDQRTYFQEKLQAYVA